MVYFPNVCIIILLLLIDYVYVFVGVEPHLGDAHDYTWFCAHGPLLAVLENHKLCRDSVHC